MKKIQLTDTQQRTVDIIRAAGGSIVRCKFEWDGGHKINFGVVRKLVNKGFLKVIALPPRGAQQNVPVKYTLVYA